MIALCPAASVLGPSCGSVVLLSSKYANFISSDLGVRICFEDQWQHARARAYEYQVRWD